MIYDYIPIYALLGRLWRL